jgi:hypothetical protein
MIRRPGGRVAYVMLATPAEGRAHWRATAAPLGLQQLYVLALCEPTVQCLQAGPSIRRPKDGHLRAFAGLEQPSPEPDQDHYRSDRSSGRRAVE